MLRNRKSHAKEHKLIFSNYSNTFNLQSLFRIGFGRKWQRSTKSNNFYQCEDSNETKDGNHEENPVLKSDRERKGEFVSFLQPKMI